SSRPGKSLLETLLEPLPGEVQDQIDEDQPGDDDPGAVDAVAGDRVCQRLPAVVGEQADGSRPPDPARGVPEEESPPLHPGEPRDPGSGVAQHGDEAPEEDRLAAVPLHQPLGPGQDAVGVALQPAPALEQPATAPAPDQPIPEVVTDD